MRTPAFLLPVLLACAAVPQARAGVPNEPQRPLFELMGVKPTGKNGYEELVYAAEAVRNSKLLERSEREGLPLNLKRALVAERASQNALRLIQQGIRKGVQPPGRVLSAKTLLPELALFRRLGRLMKMQTEVYLADGRVSDALALTRTHLAFADAIQVDTLIGGLVGQALLAIATNTIGAHLDQLSVRDCDQLYRICGEALSRPDPLPRMIELERRFGQAHLDELATAAKRADLKELQELTGLATDGQSPDGFPAGALKVIGNPEAVDRLVAEIRPRMDGYYQSLLLEARKPYRERRIPEPESDGTVAGAFLAMMAPAFNQVGGAFERGRTAIRLLAVHAAIRRYRWEYDRLPASLAELRLGDLILDPFTGEPLRYEVRGRTYTLKARGTPASADDPTAEDGYRPVTVTP